MIFIMFVYVFTVDMMCSYPSQGMQFSKLSKKNPDFAMETPPPQLDFLLDI
jgi:hypothetical protein